MRKSTLEKLKSIDFKKIMLVKNLLSILLYTLSTLIWIKNETASPILKVITFISLGLYIIMFVVIAFYSKGNLNKNMKKYKKTVKNMRTILKFINLVVLVITTISVFSFSLENIFALAFNIILLAMNIMSFMFKLFVWLVKRKINKFLKKDKKENHSFFGFILDDELFEDENTQIAEETQTQTQNN